MRRLVVFFIRQALESFGWHSGKALGEHVAALLRERRIARRKPTKRTTKRKNERK